MSENNNIKNILDALSEANKKNTHPIWIPSLNKTVQFTGINVGQQKQLIRALVDSPVYKTNFILAIYEILKANIVDKAVDIDKLTIVDKAIMLVEWRSFIMGTIYETTIDEEDYHLILNCDLMKERYQFYTTPVISNVSQNITFTVAVPTILREYKLEKELRSGPVEDIQNYDDLRKILGDAYIGELVKYITSITVNGTIVDMLSLSLKQAQEIIEKLSMDQLKEVVGFIESTQKFINHLLTFEDMDEQRSAVLNIDAAFFVTQ